MRERWTVRWFRKRALVYHLLLLVIVPGCSVAADWQIHRAISGNFLSWLYAVEWPVFAVLAVVGWWQLIHEDPARVEARKVERERRAATSGPFVPPPPETAAGFLHPLQAASHPELVSGASDRLPARLDEDAPAVHQLSEYNAYLARLAAARTRKSWRNPHGVPQR